MIQRVKHGAVDVVASTVPWNSDHLEALAKALEDCFVDGQPRLVLDFRSVALLDSEGLELLVNLYERCQRRGGNLKLAGLNPLCHDILRITGISGQFEVFEDTRAAVRSFV